MLGSFVLEVRNFLVMQNIISSEKKKTQKILESLFQLFIFQGNLPIKSRALLFMTLFKCNNII